MNSHPDLDYYDLMTLSELEECAFGTQDPTSGLIWRMIDGRTAIRDAFLDLAEEMDDEGLVLVPEAGLDDALMEHYKLGHESGRRMERLMQKLEKLRETHPQAFERDSDHG